jgi:hypothetical protein
MQIKRPRGKLFAVCLLASLVVGGCVAWPRNYHVSSSNSVTTSTNQQADPAPDQTPTGIFDEHSQGAREAWRRFSDNGRYRVARTEDFDIPFGAIQDKDVRHDINKAVKFAYVAEDINRDGVGGDRAFIVVDTARSAPRKYSLVVFNALEDERAIPNPQWLYRETDLSRTVMFWVRGELTLRDYREDGTFGLCHVKWDERRKQYSCE